MTTLPTITNLQDALNSHRTSSLQLTQAALDRIADPSGEGGCAFTRVYAEQAMQAAQASDMLRESGQVRSPLEGLPVSVKDLFDVKGYTTRAGSVVLKDEPPAGQNAVVVQRLIDAGAVLIGHTNMTEFAFSGLGINPHYGTPRSPWDRQTGRISGGSSSGAGVAVADQMSVMSLGTDTGGSIRIPAAFCGITGFKPTARRIPSKGTLPLSFSLDSTGPLAASVTCCAIADAILAGQAMPSLNPPQPGQLRLAVPSDLILDDADEHVENTFSNAILALQSAGATIDIIDIPEFEQFPYVNRRGGLIAAEAWAWHERFAQQRHNDYDPRVMSRLLRGRAMSAADYIDVLQARPAWIQAVQARLTYYDAVLMPTTPVVPPTLQALQDEDAYFDANAIILRNPTLINFLDGCALSVPCHPEGSAPVGLMIAGTAMQDSHILNVGLCIEHILRTTGQTPTKNLH